MHSVGRLRWPKSRSDFAAVCAEREKPRFSQTDLQSANAFVRSAAHRSGGQFLWIFPRAHRDAFVAVGRCGDKFFAKYLDVFRCVDAEHYLIATDLHG